MNSINEIKEPVPLIVTIFKKVSRKENNIKLRGLCVTKLIRSRETINTDEIKIDTQDVRNIADISFSFKKGLSLLKGWCVNCYTLTLRFDEIRKLDIQNKLIVNYRDKYYGRIIYNAFDLKHGRNRNSKVFISGEISAYFRQTIKNTMYLTVRETNVYDYRKFKIKVLLAFICSKLMIKKNIILMFEKECEKYEESASVLYEELINMGYENVFYILDRECRAWNNVLEKYKVNIIEKGSFKHLVYFFRCRKFIGTETLGHAIQLRAANRLIVNKVQSKRLSYVFLQHGVMYMISLDADLRSGFKQQGLDLYRVVVSSEAEAGHFIELGGFSRDELYITGLAKFDRSIRYEGADKIVVMLTWRRWETNQASTCFSETKYFKMLERIVGAIPEDLKDKLIILPHPLMRKAMENSDNILNKYFPQEDTYDEILRECDTLITDYSSIAYDAFYRGSKVIFYWEEKDECLSHYGEAAKLMLNEGNAFGEICFNSYELAEMIKDVYQNPNSTRHVDNYKKIVEFNDGKNAERIIKNLTLDRMI